MYKYYRVYVDNIVFKNIHRNAVLPAERTSPYVRIIKATGSGESIHTTKHWEPCKVRVFVSLFVCLFGGVSTLNPELRTHAFCREMTRQNFTPSIWSSNLSYTGRLILYRFKQPQSPSLSNRNLFAHMTCMYCMAPTNLCPGFNHRHPREQRCRFLQA